jgi:hypothetical protein
MGRTGCPLPRSTYGSWKRVRSKDVEILLSTAVDDARRSSAMGHGLLCIPLLPCSKDIVALTYRLSSVRLSETGAVVLALPKSPSSRQQLRPQLWHFSARQADALRFRCRRVGIRLSVHPSALSAASCSIPSVVASPLPDEATRLL